MVATTASMNQMTRKGTQCAHFPAYTNHPVRTLWRLNSIGGISGRLLRGAIYAEGQKQFEELGLLQVRECVPLLLRFAAVL